VCEFCHQTITLKLQRMSIREKKWIVFIELRCYIKRVHTLSMSSPICWGVWGEPGAVMSQTSKTIRDLDATSPKNLKASRIWVSSLICLMFPPFLVDMRHDHSHLKPNYLPPKCESPTSLAWSTLGSRSRSPPSLTRALIPICWGVRGAPGAAMDQTSRTNKRLRHHIPTEPNQGSDTNLLGSPGSPRSGNGPNFQDQ
jgi:hypothetical protein